MARFTSLAPHQAPAPAPRPPRARKIKQAMAFLQQEMGGVPHPAAEMEAAGRTAGFSHSTLRDARVRARITTHKQGKQWVWIPPRARRKPTVGTAETKHTSGKGQQVTD